MTKTLHVLVRWFDNHATSNEQHTGIDWFRIVPFIMIHLGCLLAFWVGVSATAIGIASALYFLRIFFIGAIYHRYLSHKAFTLSRGWQFVFVVLTMTAIQRGPLWWASHHRHHHLHSDKEEDLHSPKQSGFLWSHMGWFLAKKNFQHDRSKIKDFAAFPELVWLDRFDVIVPLLFGIGLFFLGHGLSIYYPHLNTSGAQMFVWGFFISTVCVYHVTFCVNSLAHKLGKQVYQTHDDSRNSWLLAFLCLGEGWHNNHHCYPASARQGFEWWEIDITYYVLKLLSVVGIVKNLKAPQRAYLAKKRIQN